MITTIAPLLERRPVQRLSARCWLPARGFALVPWSYWCPVSQRSYLYTIMGSNPDIHSGKLEKKSLVLPSVSDFQEWLREAENPTQTCTKRRTFCLPLQFPEGESRKKWPPAFISPVENVGKCDWNKKMEFPRGGFWSSRVDLNADLNQGRRKCVQYLCK